MPLRGSDNRSAGKLIKAYTQKDIGPSGLQGNNPRERGAAPGSQPLGPGIIAATGGNSTGTYTSGGENFKQHTFIGSGALVVTAGPSGSNYDMDILIVGGGGGSHGDGNDPLGPYAGNRNAGSGGGGVLYGPISIPHAIPLSNYTFPVTVGGGGAGANGGDSVINTATPTGVPAPLQAGGNLGIHTALGGGAGGSGDPAPDCDGNPGGSGGGGWYIHPGEAGETVQTLPAPYLTMAGHDGYPGTGSPEYGGGGGGAGGAGSRGPGPGPGISNAFQTGSNQTYAAGGASSDYSSTPRDANGGANTGTGAGGFGTGGSGIVIIRYRTNL